MKPTDKSAQLLKFIAESSSVIFDYQHIMSKVKFKNRRSMLSTLTRLKNKRLVFYEHDPKDENYPIILDLRLAGQTLVKTLFKDKVKFKEKL